MYESICMSVKISKSVQATVSHPILQLNSMSLMDFPTLLLGDEGTA